MTKETGQAKKKKSELKGGQGSNSTSIRSYNEKTVLHLLRFLKTASRIEMANYTDLTSQSLATITASLEKKNLITNIGKQINGIGQPSFLYKINSDGVYSIGCNIGRKTLEMVLTNFVGDIYEHRFFEYQYPVAEEVINKIKEFIFFCNHKFSNMKKSSFAGLGIGIPYFLGSWEKEFSKNINFKSWDQKKFQTRLKKEVDSPIYFENDMNAATVGAMIKGKGNHLKDFIYLYLGTFAGGGVVMDRKIVKGVTGNAGNFGTILVSLPTSSPIYDSRKPNPCQLLSYASINHLKKYLSSKSAVVPEQTKEFFALLKSKSQNIKKWLEIWLQEIAYLFTQAILISNSVLDLKYVIFDSSLPSQIVKRICQLITKSFFHFDITGVLVPKIYQGELGSDARSLGSAMIPIYEQYVPNSYVIG